MKLGKIGKRNILANKKIKQIFIDKGINYCELRLPGCWLSTTLAPAHRRRRVEYLKWPEGLYDYKEVILACTNCHSVMDGKNLEEYYFKRLRPDAK